MNCTAQSHGNEGDLHCPDVDDFTHRARSLVPELLKAGVAAYAHCFLRVMVLSAGHGASDALMPQHLTRQQRCLACSMTPELPRADLHTTACLSSKEAIVGFGYMYIQQVCIWQVDTALAADKCLPLDIPAITSLMCCQLYSWVTISPIRLDKWSDMFHLPLTQSLDFVQLNPIELFCWPVHFRHKPFWGVSAGSDGCKGQSGIGRTLWAHGGPEAGLLRPCSSAIHLQAALAGYFHRPRSDVAAERYEGAPSIWEMPCLLQAGAEGAGGLLASGGLLQSPELATQGRSGEFQVAASSPAA